MHAKNLGRFAVDEDFIQFRTAPKMMMDRKRNWAENETDLKTKIPKTKLVRNRQICSFGAENENEIRSVSNPGHTITCRISCIIPVSLSWPLKRSSLPFSLCPGSLALT